jgi:hypothetical protein
MCNQPSINIITTLKQLILSSEGNHYYKLKQGLWLYLYLLIKAHPESGKLVIIPDRIAVEIGVKSESVHSWLGQLRKHGYVQLRKQGQAYVLSLSNYPGEQPAHVSELIPDEGYEDSSKDGLTPEELEKRIGNGESLPYYRSVCRRYSKDVIAQALSDVEATPSERIRKSKGALFTFLVKKYAEEEN